MVLRDEGSPDWSLLNRETVHLHNQLVAYYRAGQGPPILLVHGITSSARTWREVMPRWYPRSWG